MCVVLDLTCGGCLRVVSPGNKDCALDTYRGHFMGGVLWATEIFASHHKWGFRCLYRGVGGYILVGTAQCGVDKKYGVLVWN